MIEQIEKLYAKLQILRLRHREKLCQRKIKIRLIRTAQAVSADITNISARRTGRCYSTGTRNYLSRLDDWPSKHTRVKEIAWQYGVCCVTAIRPGDKTWAG